MADLPYLKKKSEDDLKSSVSQNRERYINGNFVDYCDLAEYTHPPLSYANFDLGALAQLEMPTDRVGLGLRDIENAEIVYIALRDLQPTHAKDSRIWSYLSHFECFEYARARWLNVPETLERDIGLHLFCGTGSNRAFERDHAIARLWWAGFLADGVPDMKLAEALRVMWTDQDFHGQLIGRPYIGMTKKPSAAFIRKWEDPQLMKILTGEKARDSHRPVFERVNREGGVRLLAAMDQDEADDLVAKAVKAQLDIEV